MSRHLISTTEVYRVDSEAECAEIIDAAKRNPQFELKKYTSVKKERKQKGEVIDSWYQVSLKKVFTDEKEPEFSCKVSYSDGVESAF